MNSARNANRFKRGQSSTRGRGRGGRARGGSNDQNDDRPTLHPVPTTQQVIPGASVSIVLKVDQPTGHETQGIVAELLTKGNHPRGIKVRLQDGRVGRVQRMASMEAATAGLQGSSGLWTNGETGDGSGERNHSVQVPKTLVGGFTPQRYGDFRIDELDEPPSVGLSLSDYVVVKGKGKNRKKKADQEEHGKERGKDEPPGNPPAITSATSTCPVCGKFEGDEITVAHHVSTHFD
jgi:uncharacterized repeat protein (TIGR03833 family)